MNCFCLGKKLTVSRTRTLDEQEKGLYAVSGIQSVEDDHISDVNELSSERYYEPDSFQSRDEEFELPDIDTLDEDQLSDNETMDTFETDGVLQLQLVNPHWISNTKEREKNFIATTPEQLEVGDVVVYRQNILCQILAEMDGYIQIAWPQNKPLYQRAVLWVKTNRVRKWNPNWS